MITRNRKVTKGERYAYFSLFILSLFISTTVLSSCSDYLDVLPDNRAELDSDKKITELLVSAYPSSNYYLLAEMSSDNTDENADQASYTAYTKLQEQAAKWQDITDKYQDTPYALWMHCYKAIAAANNVLIAIGELGRPKRLDPQRGEALICRAYSHFILANIFCMIGKSIYKLMHISNDLIRFNSFLRQKIV